MIKMDQANEGTEIMALSQARDQHATYDAVESTPLLEVFHQSLSTSDENLDQPCFSQAPSFSTNYGRLLLLFVAFLYGTLNVTLRLVYSLDDPPQPSALSSARGWLAVACFTPFLAAKKRPSHNQESLQRTSLPKRPLWIVSLELAVWNFGAQALVNVGLLWIASARASFLTETSVVITPLVSALAGHRVKWTVLGACGVAMAGLVVLSDDDQGNLFQFGLGDTLTLCGALCWSMYICRLSDCSMYDEVNMQALKTLFLAGLYSLWFLVAYARSEDSLWAGYTNPVSWLLLLYSALGPGTIADIVQQKGQAFVSASEANVIIAMEPVFTSILGLLVLGEAMMTQVYIGGGLLIAAAVLSTE